MLRFEAEPGTQFGYSGEGYEYALRFAERRLGRPWAALAGEYVFAPTGMTNTAYTEQAWFADRTAIPLQSQGGLSRAIDLGIPERAGMGLGWEVLELSQEKVLLHTGGDAGEQAIAFYFADRRDGAVMFTNGDNGFQVMLPAIALLFDGTDLADFAVSKL